MFHGMKQLWITLLLTGLVVLLCTATEELSCPTWFFYNNHTGSCQCGYSKDYIKCDQKTERVQIKAGHCVTFSGEEGLFYCGKCPLSYNANRTSRIFAELPPDPRQLSDAICGAYKRRGLMCGECIEGYGPGVYSFSWACADCSKMSTGSAIGLYVLANFLPTTLFFILVTLLHVNITAGPMWGYILFCQSVAFCLEYYAGFYAYIDSTADYSPFLSAAISVFEFWNLRFLKPFIPPFCISDKLSGYHVLYLNLLPSIYPLVLLIVCFILLELNLGKYRLIRLVSKPLGHVVRLVRWRKADISDSLLRTFATFILLSSTANLFAVYATVQYSNVMQSISYTIKQKDLYFAPDINCYSQKHIVLSAVAFLQFSVMVVVPSLLLMLFPTSLYRCLTRGLSFRKKEAVRMFVEALHSCFKDGLNGTRDYRAVAGIVFCGFPLLGVVVSMLIYHNGYSPEISTCFLSLVLSQLVAYGRPFKLTVANASFSYYCLLFGGCALALYHWKCNLSNGSNYFLQLSISIFISAQLPVIVWCFFLAYRYFLLKQNCF